MTEQEYKELVAMRNGAPDGATHVSSNNVYYQKADTTYFWWAKGEEWIDSEIDHLTRSLADIEKLIEQHEQLQKAKLRITEMETTLSRQSAAINALAFIKQQDEVGEK